MYAGRTGAPSGTINCDAVTATSTASPSTSRFCIRKNPDVILETGSRHHISANPTSSLRRERGNHRRLISDITSLRLLWFVLKRPRTALVTVKLPGFLTPRIVMHVWTASRTTTTPFASSFSASRSAI